MVTRDLKGVAVLAWSRPRSCSIGRHVQPKTYLDNLLR
jgi:hypothetical protein